MQLASLKENKERNDQVIRTLQLAAEQKETELQKLSQQIALKEGQVRQNIPTLDAGELQLTEHTFALLQLELEDMQMKVIEAEEQLDSVHTQANLAQEEASYYKQHTAALLTVTKVMEILAIFELRRHLCVTMHMFLFSGYCIKCIPQAIKCKLLHLQSPRKSRAKYAVHNRLICLLAYLWNGLHLWNVVTSELMSAGLPL